MLTPTSLLSCERITVAGNKLTSSDTLSQVDYSHYRLCTTGLPQRFVDPPSGSRWQHAVESLHGDRIIEEPVLELRMLEDTICQILCIEETTPALKSAVEQGLHYNWLIDEMPVAYRYENDGRVAVRYWGGIPLGQRGESLELKNSDLHDPRFSNSNENQLFINNHFNFEIMYFRTKNGYRVVRTTVQPFSVAYQMNGTSIANDIVSCQTKGPHTTYNGVLKEQPQPLTEGADLVFTYDVIWTEWTGGNPSSTRWNVFLRMDDGIPLTAQLLGLVLAVLMNAILGLSLYTWLMRDLSYKPLVMETEEVSDEQALEMHLWPLSTRVFFPPRHVPVLMSICMGIGAHLLVSGFWFVLFSRLGVINGSLGASIITPAVLLYVFMSPVGGYVTGRLQCVYHGTMPGALQACFGTASIMPILGILVVHIVYDVLPDELAPEFNAVSNSTPLILLWLFLGFPLTIASGWYGYRSGPIHNFPVSEGSAGYQDLALQDGTEQDDENPRCKYWRYARLPTIFALCGIAPVLCGFVEYAYGVAGPVYVGYFSDSSSFAILSFILFNTCIGLSALILYYKQIRSQQYQWWWAAFLVGASAGLWIWILSISWVLSDASNRSLVNGAVSSYTLWFALCSLGVGLMGGFVSVLSCMIFSRVLYTILRGRSNSESQSEPDTEASTPFGSYAPELTSESDLSLTEESLLPSRQSRLGGGGDESRRFSGDSSEADLYAKTGEI